MLSASGTSYLIPSTTTITLHYTHFVCARHTAARPAPVCTEKFIRAESALSSRPPTSLGQICIRCSARREWRRGLLMLKHKLLAGTNPSARRIYRDEHTRTCTLTHTHTHAANYDRIIFLYSVVDKFCYFNVFARLGDLAQRFSLML